MSQLKTTVLLADADARTSQEVVIIDWLRSKKNLFLSQNDNLLVELNEIFPKGLDMSGLKEFLSKISINGFLKFLRQLVNRCSWSQRLRSIS